MTICTTTTLLLQNKPLHPATSPIFFFSFFFSLPHPVRHPFPPPLPLKTVKKERKKTHQGNYFSSIFPLSGFFYMSDTCCRSDLNNKKKLTLSLLVWAGDSRPHSPPPPPGLPSCPNWFGGARDMGRGGERYVHPLIRSDFLFGGGLFRVIIPFPRERGKRRKDGKERKKNSEATSEA